MSHPLYLIQNTVNNMIKITGETDKSYTAVIEGKEVTLFKVDREELDRKYIENLRTISSILPNKNVMEMLNALVVVRNNIPDVYTYEKVATELSIVIDKLYHILAPYCNKDTYNIFHHPYKKISLELYGKAQTFMKNVEMLFEDIVQICDFKLEDGSLTRFEVSTSKVPPQIGTRIEKTFISMA